MALTRTTLRSLVREIAETDSTEFSDTVLDEYSNRAFDDIIGRQSDWKLVEVEYGFSTVANTRDYSLLTIAGGSDVITDISLVTDNTTYFRELTPIRYEQGLSVFHGSNDYAAIPLYWSIRDGSVPKLNLWPKPNGVRAMVVTAWRQALWASAAGSEPELTEPLKHVIVDYVLACWFDQQEDLQMAGNYRQKYEMSVQRQMEAAQRATAAQPLVYGRGAGPHLTEKGWREMTNRRLP